MLYLSRLQIRIDFHKNKVSNYNVVINLRQTSHPIVMLRRKQQITLNPESRLIKMFHATPRPEAS